MFRSLALFACLALTACFHDDAPVALPQTESYVDYWAPLEEPDAELLCWDLGALPTPSVYEFEMPPLVDVPELVSGDVVHPVRWNRDAHPGNRKV